MENSNIKQMAEYAVWNNLKAKKVIKLFNDKQNKKEVERLINEYEKEYVILKKPIYTKVLISKTKIIMCNMYINNEFIFDRKWLYVDEIEFENPKYDIEGSFCCLYTVKNNIYCVCFPKDISSINWGKNEKFVR